MMDILNFDIVNSTNVKARELLLDGKKAPFSIMADSQTGGLGRQGRPFYSPLGGLYLTIVLDEQNIRPMFVTGFIAVCVLKIIRKYSEKSFAVKWVNDIFVDGKKVCGILVERVKNNYIIGIGINMRQCESPPDELKDIIGFLDIDIDTKIFAKEIVDEITNSNLSSEEVIKLYTRDCPVVGAQKNNGEVISVNLDGSLNVLLKDGSVIKLIS